MKKTFVAVVSVLWSVLAGAATIESVLVRQQRPWNNKVRIDYALSTEIGEAVDVTVTIRDPGGNLMESYGYAFSGDLTEVAPGERVIWWDPAKSGISADPQTLSFTLSAAEDPQRYCVIDISDTNNYQYAVSYLSATPAGGWTDDYKTTKIVLRHVKAGTFVMGTPEDEEGRRTATSGNHVYDMPQHTVTLSDDYWLGVFPLTYGQTKALAGGTTGKTGTYVANQQDTSPAVNISFEQILGWAGSDAPSWYSAPVPRDGSFLHMLGTRIVSGSLPEGVHFALPTEAQWEYACRAGTMTPYHNGTDSITGTVDVAVCVGPYVPNYHPMYPVGGYAPNAWGFYDMHGCVWQWTIDHYAYSGGSAAATDPFLPLSPTLLWPALRGGTYGTSGDVSHDNRSGSRHYRTYTVTDGTCGARIALVKRP